MQPWRQWTSRIWRRGEYTDEWKIVRYGTPHFPCPLYIIELLILFRSFLSVAPTLLSLSPRRPQHSVRVHADHIARCDHFPLPPSPLAPQALLDLVAWIEEARDQLPRLVGRGGKLRVRGVARFRRRGLLGVPRRGLAKVLGAAHVLLHFGPHGFLARVDQRATVADQLVKRAVQRLSHADQKLEHLRRTISGSVSTYYVQKFCTGDVARRRCRRQQHNLSSLGGDAAKLCLTRDDIHKSVHHGW
mmetsp:Transcript_41931/g.82204  ORF Transcript_41931/g.82204 Transcript_41931/m.82204 type:complete len:245 (+) Transcript_41931:202-936(+)